MARRLRIAARIVAVVAVAGGALPVAVAVVAVVGAASPGAAAAAARTVRVGAVQHAALTRRAPTLSPRLRLHVTIALKPRNAASLAAYAQAVSSPGNVDYRHFLTPDQFRVRFGALGAQVSRVRAALRARGLHPGPTSAGGLSIPVTATAGQLDRAFAVSLRRIVTRGRRVAVASTAAPALDAAAADAVQSVIGLDTTVARRPELIRPARYEARPALDAIRRGRPRVVTGGPQACPAAQAAAPAAHAYTTDQIASAYGFSGLYAAGDTGAGTTIAVYELEPDDPADLAAFQACYGTHTSVSYVRVDGGAGRGPGGGESALDIENTIGLAPGANVLVYQGPNSNSGAPGSGPYDIFSSIINQDRAQVVSVSWGECERALGATDAAAENTLFEQAAVQGQSVVSAAGDSGAQDCDTPGSVPQTRPSVDDPASQPYVVGVGGTSLTALGPPPTEAVWNNPAAATAIGSAPAAGAGGGGVSSLWPMPFVQQHAAAALGVIKPDSAGRVCGLSHGNCREVPDVAADADPNTGYQIYWNGSGTVVGQPAGWQGIGGTSGAAPVWAAVLALADSAPGCADSPLGFAGPPLYRAADTAYITDFHDVVGGDNDFAHTNGGRFLAGPGYDLASGLGTPDAAALVASLCTDSLRLRTPSTETSAEHAAVSVRVRGVNISGTPIRYSVRGLPPGLELDTATGVISGRPIRRGDFTVRVDGRDAAGSSATASFRWAVAAPLRISQAFLAMRGPHAPQLTVTVVAPAGAPLIHTVALSVPPGLRLRSTHSVSLVTDPGPLVYEDSAHLGTLTVSLGTPAKLCQVIISAPSLSGAPRRRPRAARLAGRIIAVTVGDDNRGASRLTARLKGG